MTPQITVNQAHGILQAILEWVAISFSRGSSGIEPESPALAGGFFTISATREFDENFFFFRD